MINTIIILAYKLLSLQITMRLFAVYTSLKNKYAKISIKHY